MAFYGLGLSFELRTSSAWAETVKGRYQDLQIFTKVLNLIQQYYVEEVDVTQLIHGGIKGMLRELDPHTNFLPADIFKSFETETKGEFGGLGIEITTKKGILTVISPIEDTPAWKAGVLAGDIIVSINGVSTKGLSLVEAAQHMRGKMGSKVKLGIIREGQDEPITIEVVRDIVKVKSVKYTSLNDGYGYFRLTSFIENTGGELEKALGRLKKENEKINGIIIDLRSNPGGLLDQAVRVSDLFVSDGVIVSTEGRNEKTVTRAHRSGTLEGFPIVVLVDEASASASEIVAGALQDNKRALIIGKRTFGKGSVQSVVKLGDGSGLKLTVARYFTPSGRSIQAHGIEPDIDVDALSTEILTKAVIRRQVRREQDIEGHLENSEFEGSKVEKSGDKSKESTDAETKAMFFWSTSEQKDQKLSAREKLLKNDFQVLQAYNYLRAWKMIK
jgi:carboxyl-terminal processing protease